jgi:aminodeoxyfutalosine synthase
MKNSGFFHNAGLADIAAKVEAGDRLSLEDGHRLFECSDINALGALAHQARVRRHGRKTHYIVNRHINYTNVCVNGCLFCAYSRKRADQKGAFELSLEEIEARVRAHEGERLSEIHIVGGCHPDLPLSFFEDALSRIRALRPETTLKCFTSVEIAHFARLEGVSVREVLQRLKAAGLDMMPGGGAEIFNPEVRKRICPEKLDAEGWLDVAGQAHELGIRTNCTMLYGHLETVSDRLDHLDRLRRQQDETGGFVCFIPLSFQVRNNLLGLTRQSTGVDDLRTMAVSRLMLDNIPHVKAYWIMLGVKLAQVALYYGADDLDGTVVEEKIGHMAGADSDDALTRQQLESMIRRCGFEPVQRDSFFNPVEAFHG